MVIRGGKSVGSNDLFYPLSDIVSQQQHGMTSSGNPVSHGTFPMLEWRAIETVVTKMVTDVRIPVEHDGLNKNKR